MRESKVGTHLIGRDDRVYEIVEEQQCDPSMKPSDTFYYAGWSYFCNALKSAGIQGRRRFFYEHDVVKFITKDKNPEYWL